MARAKKKAASTSTSTGDHHYKKVDELPEERRKAYESILEDFDKQVEARIDENEMLMVSLQKQVRAHFKMALLQIPRKIRAMKFDELVQAGTEPRLSEQLAAVKATVETAIDIKVIDTNPKHSTAKKGGRKGGKALSTSSETSVILAPPSTGVRQSTRKRVPKNYSDSGDATPLVVRGRSKTVMQTPANNHPGPNCGLPFITPKFNMATPLHRSVMRTAKPNETLVSLSGSPVYVGATAGRGRGRKPAASESEMIPVPIGAGKTLMVPAEVSNGDDCMVDLDDDAKQRLMALKSQIDNMLKIRSDD